MLTEVTKKERLSSIRSPFSVCDVVVFVDIETKLFNSLLPMSVCSAEGMECNDPAELFEAAFILVDGCYPVLCLTESLLQSVFEWREPWIESDNSCAEVSNESRPCVNGNLPVPSGGP